MPNVRNEKAAKTRAGGKNSSYFDIFTKSFREEVVLKKIELYDSNEEKYLYFTRG